VDSFAGSGTFAHGFKQIKMEIMENLFWGSEMEPIL
jgi:hypothetical protein